MLAITGVVVVVVALAVVLPLLLLGGRHTTSGAQGPSSPSSRSSPTPMPSTTAPSPSATMTPLPTTSSPAAQSTKPPAPPPTLLVRADRGISWLTVTDAHGRTRYNGYVHRGEQRRFDGPFFRVVVGDAAAVTVLVNGVPRPRGAPGQVLRFTVTGH
jgi:Domain of unknown function (DUF4115)